MSCGFCASICPEKCITMKFNLKKGYHEPIVYEQKCIECHKCIDVCPGESVDFPTLNQVINNDLPEYHNIGVVKRTCLTFSTDEKIRREAASGGFITRFLNYLFDQRIIDGAILTKPSQNDAFNPIGYIAYNFDETLSSQMSIYNSVPIGSVIRDIQKDSRKYAFVGIPCQVHGLLKYIKICPEVKKNIQIIIGTFCGGYQTYYAHQYYFPKIGIPFQNIQRIDYRYGEFPGSFRIRLKNGTEKILPRRFSTKKLANRINTAFNSMFYIPRCYLCADKGNILADISAGDPWIPDCKQEKLGQSIVLIRSKKGMNYFSKAINENYIHANDILFSKVMNAQKFNQERHGNQKAYQKLYGLLGKKCPHYSYMGKYQIVNRKIYIRAFIDFFKPFLQRHRWTWRLLKPLYFCEKHIRNIFIYNNPYDYFFNKNQYE